MIEKKSHGQSDTQNQSVSQVASMSGKSNANRIQVNAKRKE